MVERLDIDAPAEAGFDLRNAMPGVNFLGAKLQRVEYDGGTYEEIVDHPLWRAQSAAEVDRYAWPRPEDFDVSAVWMSR